MRNLHSWKTRTPERGRREARAHLFGKRWKFEVRHEDEDAWTSFEKPLLEDLMALRQILFNKYQRKHLAWDHVAGVDRLIQESGGPREDE